MGKCGAMPAAVRNFVFICGSDDFMVNRLGQARFEASLTRGIRIFLWNLTGRTIHAKAMIVDDSLAMVGTYNFDSRSSSWDTENAIFSTDPAVIQAVDDILQKDFAESFVNEIDLDWVASQPFCDQFLWDILGLASPRL